MKVKFTMLMDAEIHRRLKIRSAQVPGSTMASIVEDSLKSFLRGMNKPRMSNAPKQTRDHQPEEAKP